jgi:hypothetical protein
VAQQVAVWVRPEKARLRAVAQRRLERRAAPGAHRGAAERRELREQVQRALDAELRERRLARRHLERKA